MSLSVSVPELLSDLAADATAITLDMPQGGYDRLHALIESAGLLPTDRRGRIALIAASLLASRILKQRLGPLGPVANYANEVGEDAIREAAKRILESTLQPAPEQLALSLNSPLPRPPRTPTGTSVAGDAIRSVNDFFFPWMRLRREVSS